MRLPIHWLKKYIEISATPQELAEALTMSGSAVEEISGKGDQATIHIEVTTNRPDCLSLLGLAQEVSALSGRKVNSPAVYRTKEKPRRTNIFSITIEDKKSCAYYSGRLMDNVNVRSSDAQMQTYLNLAGTRPISNVVDATNYVLYECGQPLHAFDFDKIEGARILVRRARDGEKFLGLDGVEYTLDAQTLVIADAVKPIAIAGVIGGKLTEVTESTKRVLLESAYFDQAVIRQASKKYKIVTESSYRFERSVNPETVPQASKRAAELIAQWTGGADVTGLVERNFLPRQKTKQISLRIDRVERLLGIKIPAPRIAKILKKLDFRTKQSKKGVLTVPRSNRRRDVTQEADLVEEILRIEGFERIPVELPITRHGPAKPIQAKMPRILELKKYLSACGFSEIVTYSLLSERALRQSGGEPSHCHRIQNPVSAEQAYFRPDLLGGMFGAIVYNLHRKAAQLKFYEIGNCYQDGQERTDLAVCVTGMMEENWRRKSQAGYYDLKGIIENILRYLMITDYHWKHHQTFEWSAEASVLSVADKPVGFLGRVSEPVARNWDITEAVYFGRLKLDELLEIPSPIKTVRPVPKYPSVRRDIALIADETIPVADLERLMQQKGQPFIRQVVVFDEYKGKNIPSGKRSLAFSLHLQKETGTFTDEEIQKVETTVKEALKSQYHVEYR